VTRFTTWSYPGPYDYVYSFTSRCLKIHFNIILPSILTFPGVHIKIRAGRPMNNFPSTAPGFIRLRYNGHRCFLGVKRPKREENAQVGWAIIPIPPYVMTVRCLMNHRADCMHGPFTFCPRSCDAQRTGT